LRVVMHFHDLRVLVRALRSSIHALVWSMVLVFLIVAACAFALTQLLTGFVTSDAEYEARLWVYKHFGTATKAMWTMFEITFSGGTWVLYTETMMEEVSVWCGLFWACYIVGVHFAVMRIISAMFLKETMKIAQSDTEAMTQEKMKHKDKFVSELGKFFRAADTSGDGLISCEEFEAIMDDPEIVKHLSIMEIEAFEMTGLFHLLDDGDGEVSFEEFLQGAMRLKGNARSSDSIAIMHAQDKMKNILAALREDVELIASGVKGGAKFR